jgi:predicted acetyltransferase
MPETREPEEKDREAMAHLEGLAFNYVPTAEQVELEGALCSYDGGRPVAMVCAIPLAQWFAGRTVSCAGISSVATLPEYRGHGVARALVSTALRKQRASGRLVSALYPSTASLYRSLGYEFGGVRPQFRTPVRDLPAVRPRAEELQEGDLEGLMDCHSGFAAGHNGLVESREAAWWHRHALAHEGEGTLQRTVVVRGRGELAGYASYYTAPGEAGYQLVCKHLVARDGDALLGLLGYFRRFENGATDFAWYGPPHGGPVGLALGSNGFQVQVRLTRWMARVLDVAGALQARGYADVSGEAVLEIADPLFPENTGPWHVRAEAGRVSVLPTEAAAGRPLPIGAFSALYTGFATPQDLVQLGVLSASDARLAFLALLFAGPTPWMADFF